MLQALFRGQGLSRADLSRELGLSRVTMSDVVGDLVEEGLVIELGTRSSSRPGKPAMLLEINRQGHHIIGLDLSGS
ncbi:MAG: helix-turn-helix domain-containing protein [Acidimicrobiales bacterium]